jgi:hypothetical protein
MPASSGSPGSGNSAVGIADSSHATYERVVAPARGPFPAGCKWRAVSYKGKPVTILLNCASDSLSAPTTHSAKHVEPPANSRTQLC